MLIQRQFIVSELICIDAHLKILLFLRAVSPFSHLYSGVTFKTLAWLGVNYFQGKFKGVDWGKKQLRVNNLHGRSHRLSCGGLLIMQDNSFVGENYWQ